MEKGINYSKALGADKDRQSRHSTVIFPFYTQTGGPGQVRQEFQIRVPIDDTNTYHIAYGCYTAPEAVDAGQQESIPYYDIPIFDEDGRPMWDFVLAQDAPTLGFPKVTSTTGRKNSWAGPICPSCLCAVSLRSRYVSSRMVAIPKTSSGSAAPCPTSFTVAYGMKTTPRLPELEAP